MLISLLGSVINTENIYTVSEIYDVDDFTKLQFSILMMNDIYHYVTIDTNCSLCEYGNGQIVNLYTGEEIKRQVRYQNNLSKINTLRDKLICYWSQNQSTIPKLEFI